MRPVVSFLDPRPMQGETQAELNAAWQSLAASGNPLADTDMGRFEEAWAHYCGVGQCVALDGPESALEFALRAVGVGPEDEVIVPANCPAQVLRAIRTAGGCPVKVDTDPRTLLITASLVEAALTSRTSAVVAVHLFGSMADMDALMHLSRRSGVAVIEFTNNAHGAMSGGRRAGSQSDIACFGFGPANPLGGFGISGAVVTDIADLAHIVRGLRGSPLSVDSRRMSEIDAAAILAKLPHLDRWNTQRRRVARQYRKALAGLPVVWVEDRIGSFGTAATAAILLRSRDHIHAAMQQAGIQTMTEAWETLPVPRATVSEASAGQLLLLPMFPHLSAAQIGLVAEALRSALQPSSSLATALTTAAGSFLTPSTPDLAWSNEP